MKQLFQIPAGSTTVEVETLDPKFSGTTPPPPPPPPVNHAPVVNAGSDISITSPATSADLKGTATDPDTGGTIAAYLWERRAGSGEIQSPNSQNTKVINLKAGVSTFRLTAIDNLGASGFDDVGVNLSAVTPPPPDPVGYSLVYENPFEKDSDIRNENTGQAGRGVISKTVFKEGAGSFYSIPENVSSGIRSEIQGFPTPTTGAMEWWVYYEKVIPNNGHSFQFHPNTSGGSASPGLWHDGGKFVWYNWKSGANYQHSTGVTIPVGRWLKMRIEYTFGTNGSFKHWMDGTLICSWTGLVGDGSGQYCKCGYNGWDSQSVNSRIYYDTLKVFKKS